MDLDWNGINAVLSWKPRIELGFIQIPNFLGLNEAYTCWCRTIDWTERILERVKGLYREVQSLSY